MFDMRIFVLVGIVLCLASAAQAAQGNAVFYKPPYTPSACYGNRNDGTMVTGVSDALWNNGRACGRRYRVRCIRGTNEAPHPCRSGNVVVKVVDRCKTGCNGVLNLSQDAFAKIANPDAGNVIVDYTP
ncbi:EG45-like domain containing protein isoform X2 [Pistacia vera]|nr:EG45-like domain containing protein isoform X2 [Pistacia vera]